MKRTLLVALLALFSLSLNAQDHLKFKGIPIDGSLNSFVSKLKAQGFSYKAEQDGMALLEGTFAGYTQCELVVVSTNDVVWKVVVMLPANDKWNDVKRNYDIFKKSFTEKYGVTPESEEHIDSYGGEGSGFESHAFDEDKAVWRSDFAVPGGTARVMIRYASYSRLQLWIEYYDDLNSTKRNRTIIDDI